MRRSHWQEGMALVTTMVLVLLAALLLASALRSAWFNELIAGNELDYQRAFENAQALLRDAEADIRGDCVGAASGHCRQPAGLRTALPRTLKELASLSASLAGRRPACLEGLCIPDGLAAEFWRAPSGELDRMKAVAARHGEFSGAPVPAASHPLLWSKGWYWIEILPFDSQAPVPQGKETLQPDADRAVLYRITALAEGRKPATQAVLQSVMVWQRDAP